jgi:hypothetical protein
MPALGQWTAQRAKQAQRRSGDTLLTLRSCRFGVVHLANYSGQQVAAKQLMNIAPETVKRFRFECFLMKNLRHPNIVRLVGVCWDDQM